MSKHILQREDDKWYYLDETSDFNGPYDTEEEATDMFKKHIEWLNQPNLNHGFRAGELSVIVARPKPMK